MTLYAMFTPAPDSRKLPQAVAEKFSWFAALLPPVHALAHRLWGQLAFYVLGLGAILAASAFIGAAAAFWLYVLLALACGFAAAGARSRAYRRRGFALAGHRLAASADLARLALLERRP